MRIGALIEGLQTNPIATGVIQIGPGSYKAGGVNTPEETVTVAEGFQTPPGDVTNTHGDAVLQKFGATPDGLYLRDKITGYHYLYALGQGDDLDTFETLDPRLLPPVLGIKERFEEILTNPQVRSRFELGLKKEDIKRALPKADRYEGLHHPVLFAASDVALTRITGWQAQAVAQLLGDPELAQKLFGISGSFYADLLTNEQWGLMAMESILDFMTAPNQASPRGKLTDAQGRELRAHALSDIVVATNYPALPNGILPNTVWTRVKDFIEQDRYQVLRGGSWDNCNPDSLRSGYRSSFNPDDGVSNLVGLRVGFFPRA